MNQEYQNKMLTVGSFLFCPLTYFRFVNENSKAQTILKVIFACILSHLVGILTFATKNLYILNAAMNESIAQYRIDETIVYGLSVFSTLTYWLVFLLCIIHFICFDIVFGKGSNILKYIRISSHSFYCFIPYSLLVLILSILYAPSNLPSPLILTQTNIQAWHIEAINHISNNHFYSAIKIVGYLSTLWFISLTTLAYKTFSNKSSFICFISGLLFLIEIVSLKIII